MLEKNNKKTINGWCMYDWANSVYALVITTAIFPEYFLGVTSTQEGVSNLSLFGIEMTNSVVYSYTITVAFLLVALLNPFLSAIADSGGNKKKFMQFFCYLGAASCTGLFFFTRETPELGVILFGLAGVGFAGSLVFYNSFLPEIASEDRFDKVSAKGFALGYIGSVLLLVVNLVMILQPSVFHIPVDLETGKALDGTLAPRISFLTVGVWWAGFAQFTFRRLPDNVYGRKVSDSYFKKGITEFKKVYGEVQQLPLLKRFLVAFLFYSMGVQTVMYMATVFGKEVVKLEQSELIVLVLILQFLAIFGAYLFSLISNNKGNIFSLTIIVAIWVGVCAAAYFIGAGMKTEFYILGGVVGTVMGGVQSMSRSTYSKLIPQETKDHASYFSFYETIEKLSIALGTFVYGLVLSITGTMNNSTLALGVFFIIGLLLLLRIPSKKIYNTSLDNPQGLD